MYNKVHATMVSTRNAQLFLVAGRIGKFDIFHGPDLLPINIAV